MSGINTREIKIVIGQQFGNWIVADIISAGKIACRCTCGVVKFQRQTDLLRDKMKKCSKCYHKNRNRRNIKIGDQFGDWLVISDKKDHVIVNNIKVERKWHVRCKCGYESTIRTSHLTGKRSVCCSKCSIQKRRTFVGQIATWVFNRARSGAKERGLEWNISDQYLWNLFQKQLGECALSGVELAFSEQSSGKEARSNTTASLDRIDSSKGYIEGNVQWIHKNINKMKMDFDQKQFIEVCQKITLYQNLDERTRKYQHPYVLI